MTSSPDWYDPAHRVPRRDQVVRVHTRTGVDHVAQFVVNHTDDWPSGASWSLGNDHAWLPFADVERWSPDPQARPPGRPPAPDPATSLAHSLTPAGAPAIVAEIQTEIRRSSALLRLIPPDHIDWSPSPSLPTLRVLAQRLVRIAARISWILEFDEVELAFEPTSSDLAAVTDLVASYDANVDAILALMETTDGASLRAPWELLEHGEPVARMPRGTALRELGITPTVYHRGEAAMLLASLGVTPPHPYPVWAFKDE